MNPFPDPAHVGLPVELGRRLRMLAAQPIPDAEFVRTTLRGHMTEEVVEGLAERFVPGAYKEVTLTWG
jgi:hypothetical protein